MAGFAVLHTSDIHNKLTDEYARRLGQLKAGIRDCLMLDSGDAVWAGNIFWRPGGEPILGLMNAVPYDAMCIGNREFHFLSVGLNSKTALAEFPVLSANLRASKPESKLPVQPYAFFNRCGLSIAVIGLSVPCITERMMVRKLSQHYFIDPLKAAGEVVRQVREEADVVVALTHIGIKEDRRLAANVEGIDLILGGHTHTITEKPERVGRTWIVHHGAYLHHVGKVEVELDDKDLRVTNELIPVAKA